MGEVIQMDSLRSLVAGMGTDRDKAATTYYDFPFVTDDQLLNAYRGAWLPRKIVDIPAKDGVRAWRDWQADADQIGAIEAEEKRLGLQAKVLEAKTKARLFGGAAIYIGTVDNDLLQPFEQERVGRGGVRYLAVMTRQRLTAGDIDPDPLSEFYGQPLYYQVTSIDRGTVQIHPSRLVRFVGAPHPDAWMNIGMNAGWGDSILQVVFDAIRNADSTAANIASLVFEANVDVVKIPGFMAALADEKYRQRLMDRATLAATAKGINKTLMLDGEEEYERKAASFTNLPEIMQSFLQMVSGAADIPVTRLLGQSPAGMNSTGESDLRNYYDRVSSEQELEMRPAMHRLDEALIRSALGARPEEIHYAWAPLWQLSDKEKAEIGKMKSESAEILGRTGLFTSEEMRTVVANQMVEDGFYPGLEDAMEETGEEWQPDLGQGEGTDPAVDPAQQQDAAPRTLYVRRDVLNAAEIIAHFKAQGFETTLPADDLHVTITFSRRPVDWMEMGENWSGDEKGQLTINAGGPRMMDRFGEATVLLFASSHLSWRHEDMIRNGASWDHPEYQPHITISWAAADIDLANVEPWTGRIELGPEQFEEIKEDWQASIEEA